MTIENDWAYAAGPRNLSYDARIDLGGKTVWQTGALTHFHHALAQGVLVGPGAAAAPAARPCLPDRVARAAQLRPGRGRQRRGAGRPAARLERAEDRTDGRRPGQSVYADHRRAARYRPAAGLERKLSAEHGRAPSKPCSARPIWSKQLVGALPRPGHRAYRSAWPTILI
ncbi:hypothetical protein LP420_19385 [Massilia sp. B-10]|nr:hypothetical protein LP420_19385 [Massilia sp. B-10]